MKSFDKFIDEMKKIDGNLINEEVKNQLIEIFNAAVEVRVKEMKDQLKEEMTTDAVELKEEMTKDAEDLRDELITEAEEYKHKLMMTLDTFLEETVDDFFEKYENNIEDDVKLVFYENFFNHVKEGFEKHNFTLDESDISIVETVKKEMEKKDEIINEKIEEIYQLKEEVLKQQVKSVLEEETGDMSEIEREKLYKIIEDVDFENIEDARKKIKLFKEKFGDVEEEDVFSEEFPISIKNTKNDDVASKWASMI